MIRIKMDVTKLNKDLFFKGQKGTYADITLMDNRDGTDQYGNDGFVVQDVGKERREAGEKGPIVGNWKHVGQRSDLREPQGARSPEYGKRETHQNGAAPPPAADDYQDDDSSDIPF